MQPQSTLNHQTCSVQSQSTLNHQTCSVQSQSTLNHQTCSVQPQSTLNHQTCSVQPHTRAHSGLELHILKGSRTDTWNSSRAPKPSLISQSFHRGICRQCVIISHATVWARDYSHQCRFGHSEVTARRRQCHLRAAPRNRSHSTRPAPHSGNCFVHRITSEFKSRSSHTDFWPILAHEPNIFLLKRTEVDWLISQYWPDLCW